MWKLIQISQQSYFIHCNFTSSEEVTFILYDLKETWCETLPFNEVKQKVKLLNKRCGYNEEDIKETLLNGDLQTASLEQQPHTSSTKQESCVIKLKYRVKNYPFNLDWSLRRQTLEEFQSIFMQPLFTALLGCSQQVEILTDILRKKDAELTQYRKEGAVLHRKTLATKSFDFNEFSKKYKDSTELAKNYTELAKFVVNNKQKMGGPAFSSANFINKEETKLEIPLEEKTAFSNNTNTKMSPKQRKRKVLDMKQQQLERQQKVRKNPFQYESSQSQTPSSNSQSNEETIKAETDQKDLKDEIQNTPKKETECGSDNLSTPRRRIARCKPIKYNEDNDEQTDSGNDNDNNKRSLREGNTTKSLNTKETGKSVDKCISTNNLQNNNNNAGGTSDKITKSPTLSYNSLKISPAKSKNIYDFSTDSEYEITTKVRRKSLTTSPSITVNRKTRSSPQVSKSTTNNEIEQSRKYPSCNTPIHDTSKNLRHSSTVVVEDISSQLDAIKKELECLEALRLADLQKRTCIA